MRRPGNNNDTFQSASTDSDLTDYALNRNSRSKTPSKPKTLSKSPYKPKAQTPARRSEIPRFSDVASASRRESSRISSDRRRSDEASGSRKSLKDGTSRKENRLQEKTRSKRKSDKPINIKALRAKQMEREIRNLQSRPGNVVPKLPFSRVIREVLRELGTTDDMRVTFTALETIQESAELYLTQLFEDSYRCTLHRGRVTLQIKDIQLARYFRGPNDPGNR